MATLEPPKTIMDDDGQASGEVPDLSEDTMLDVYEAMVATRRLNERGMKLQRQGRIHFYVGSMGQEASHVGFGAALEDDDWYFPHYRDPGVALLRGASIEQMVHQCYGTAEDRIQGRQMPNHYSFEELNYYSISSPLATQIPHAVGAAYAADFEGDDVVTAVGFGDGSTSEGDFHEGLNFAGVFDAPVVFLNQNNQWAISVPRERQTKSETIAQKAHAYGIDGVQVDGNDILGVYHVTNEAVERARSEKKPRMIEALTYRMGMHTTADDPSKYRTDDEVEPWRERDPIPRFRAYLIEKGVLDEGEHDQIKEEVEDEISDAVKAFEERAEELGDPVDMFDHHYDEMPPYLAKQKEEFTEYWRRHDVWGDHRG